MNIIVKWLTKPKYTCKFLRREFDKMKVVKSQSGSDIQKVIKMGKDKSAVLDINTPAYISRNERVYLIDNETGSQLTLTEVERQLGPEEIDLMFGTKILKDLTSGLLDKNKERIMYIAVGFIIGALLAFSIMQYQMSAKVEELLKEYNTKTEFPTIGLIKNCVRCFFWRQ